MRMIIRTTLTTLIAFIVLSSPGFAVVKLRHIVSVYQDAQEKGLKQPEGVACGKDSVFVVADTGNGRLVRYTFKNNLLMAGPDMKVPQLAYPVRVQIDGSGNILALDERQRRIVRLSPEGEFKEYVEPSGMPGSSPLVPRSFKVAANGNLYILDIFSANVVVLDAAGKFLRNIAFPDHVGFISDLAVDPRETVLLIDSVESVVYTAARDAKKFVPLTQSMKETVNFPTSITTDKKGTIYVVDQTGGDIIIIGQDGTFQGRQMAMGWKEGLLRYPSQACINDEGDFFVADRNNNRVQIYEISE
jgi:DNA-binding beta-propeller fold protein YncE